MSYTTVTHHSLGGNILRSIKSFFVGLILFVISFPVLWWNEGRLDVSTVAKTATVITADGAGGKAEGALIAVTAGLATDETLGDPDFLKPATHIQIKRKSEMFAWVEKRESHERDRIGGGSDTITTYTYDTQWTDDPQKSDGFQEPEDHENPEFPVDSKDLFANSAKVGAFVITPKEIELPPTKPLPIDDSMMISYAPHVAPVQPAHVAPAVKPHGSASAPPHGSAVAPHATAAPHASGSPAPKSSAPKAAAPAKPGASGSAAAQPENNNDVVHSNRPVAELHPHRDGTFIYMGGGTIAHPGVGDVRVSFSVVDPMPGPVTLYGIRKGNTVTPWIEPGDKILPAKLYRVVPGTHAEAIKLMHGEYETTTWVIRFIGFFLMWFGLALTVSPINAVLSIVPFLGQAGRLMTSVVMFPMALVLTGLTISLSIIAHHPLMLIVPVVVAVGIFGAVRMFGKKTPPMQPGMAPQQGGYPQQGYPPQGGYGGPPPGGGYGGPPPGGGYGGPPPGGGYGGPPPGGGY